MPVLKRQFNRPIQINMTWPDPNTINTKDDTVSNCGSWLVHKYNNDQIRSPLCVGAFFNTRSRETSEAKASLGAFPPIPIAPRNVTLNKAWRFTRACRLHFHAAIYKCFDDFNHTNGKVVALQNGIKMNMAKALILAIYCDHPAGRKCCLCGSACPLLANLILQNHPNHPSAVQCYCEHLATLQTKRRYFGESQHFVLSII